MPSLDDLLLEDDTLGAVTHDYPRLIFAELVENVHDAANRVQMGFSQFLASGGKNRVDITGGERIPRWNLYHIVGEVLDDSSLVNRRNHRVRSGQARRYAIAPDTAIPLIVD